jgi:hypothetical protein
MISYHMSLKTVLNHEKWPKIYRLRNTANRDYTNCTSVQELEKLRHQSEGKLFGGLHLIHEDEEEEEGKVSPRKRPRLAERPQLGAAYTQADYSLERIDTFHLKAKLCIQYLSQSHIYHIDSALCSYVTYRGVTYICEFLYEFATICKNVSTRSSVAQRD